MILRLSEAKYLSVYKNFPIYTGENKFGQIKVLLPDTVEGNNIDTLTLKLHMVNDSKEYFIFDLTIEQDSNKRFGYIAITNEITSVPQTFKVYLEMIDNAQEKSGKTNAVNLVIDPIPNEITQIFPKAEYEKQIDTLTKILSNNTEAMNRINGFSDGENGKSAYEIAVDNGFNGTEQEWLASLKGEKGDSYALTDSDKQKIAEEVSIKTVSLEGSELTLNAEPNVQYICGEVTSLTLVPAESGITSVIFTSGETAAMLTLPDTVKMPEDFEVEANKTYEINIMHHLGLAVGWS